MTIDPGYYAVPDPADDTVMTYWSVDLRGVVRDFPASARWRPSPPQGKTRDMANDEWYRTVYHPWRASVSAAIAADPATSRALFIARFPHPDQVEQREHRPRTPGRRSSIRRTSAHDLLVRDAYEDVAGLVAYALRDRGHTWPAIADALGVSEATARRRAAHGDLIIATPTTTKTPGETLADAITKLITVHGGTLTDALKAITPAPIPPDRRRLDRRFWWSWDP